MKVKKIVLGIGILVVYALVLWQGIAAFYPTPEFQDFCGIEARPAAVKFGGECTFNSEVQNRMDSCNNIGGYFRADYDENGCLVGGECDECNLDYDDARDKHSRNVFIISLIVGIITFIVGFLILRVEPVGSALLASGVWAVFYGTVWNWRNFGAGIRFALLLVVLIVLIWIALRMNKKRKYSKL